MLAIAEPFSFGIRVCSTTDNRPSAIWRVNVTDYLLLVAYSLQIGYFLGVGDKAYQTNSQQYIWGLLESLHPNILEIIP